MNRQLYPTPTGRVTCLVAGAAALSCWFCNKPAIADKQPAVDTSVVNRKGFIEQWANEEWTNDNSPYRKMREKIGGMNIRSLKAAVGGYRVAAQDKPLDPEAQFRWVFAAYRLELKSPTPANSPLQTFRYALSRPAPPKARDYSRLRFLLEADAWRRPALQPLGERLLKADPSDRAVGRMLFSIRSGSPNMADRWKNVAEARSAVKSAPNKWESHIMLASSYFSVWGRTKKRTHANMSIASYRKTLQLLPTTPAFASRRRTINRFVANIPITQAAWEKKGIGSRD